MRFHAAAPPGEWLNDPNALFFENGRYHLFAQHAADATDFARIGWGAFESDDLLHWRWQGRVVEVDGQGRFAYSGSVAGGESGLAAALTRHDPATHEQSQEWLGGFGAAAEPFGPAGRDCRDPFIISAEPGNRVVLIARPCNWNDWREAEPSRLEIWRESKGGWNRTGMVGPWSPAGVLWEVPQLFEIDGRDILIVSTVDRRGGGAISAVFYWIGRLDNDAFEVARDFPAEGKRLDLGPDFYAAIVNTRQGWHREETVLIAWASSWDYARRVELAGGSRGGPMTLPRRLSLASDGLSLHQEWAVAPQVDAVTAFAVGARAEVRDGANTLEFERIRDMLRLNLTRPPLPPHTALLPVGGEAGIEVRLVRDGPLIEAFVDPGGAVFTALIAGTTDARTAMIED